MIIRPIDMIIRPIDMIIRPIHMIIRPIDMISIFYMQSINKLGDRRLSLQCRRSTPLQCGRPLHAAVYIIGYGKTKLDFPLTTEGIKGTFILLQNEPHDNKYIAL